MSHPYSFSSGGFKVASLEADVLLSRHAGRLHVALDAPFFDFSYHHHAAAESLDGWTHLDNFAFFHFILSFLGHLIRVGRGVVWGYATGPGLSVVV